MPDLSPLGWELWVTASAVLVIIEVLVGLGYFALPFAIGSLLTGLAIGLGILDSGSTGQPSLVYILSVFGGGSVIALLVLRRFARATSENDDINKY